MTQLSDEIPRKFIKHLYTLYNLDDCNKLSNIGDFFGNHSKIISCNNQYNNLEEIASYYIDFFESLKHIEPTEMIYLPSGSRGFLIHIKGRIELNDGSKTTFSESLVIREANKKKINHFGFIQLLLCLINLFIFLLKIYLFIKNSSFDKLHPLLNDKFSEIKEKSDGLKILQSVDSCNIPTLV